MHDSDYPVAMPSQAGVSATVVDARFCKPLDTQLLRQVATEHAAMITVEEGSIGGFAAHVMQASPALLQPTLPDSASPAHLLWKDPQLPTAAWH